MNRIKKLVSVGISAVITLAMMLDVFALGEETNPIYETETSFVEAELVSELTHMRGAKERHFQMSDGSYCAVSYAEQIYYQDENENWIEVDNRLRRQIDENGNTFYKNRDGLFEVEFAEPGDNSRDTVTIHSDENTLSWKVYGQMPEMQAETSLRAIDVDDPELIPIAPSAQLNIDVADYSILSSQERLAVAEKAVSRLSYENALGSGTDVIYDIVGNKIKESIVIENYIANQSYVAEITAYGLSAELLEDGGVVFSDNGIITFTIQAPYMIDSNNKVSADISVTMTEIRNGVYALTYIPDDEWLEDEERAYPVILDPTVEIDNNDRTVSGISYNENTLYWNGSTGYGIDTQIGHLKAGHKDSLYYFTLINYTDLPTLPNNADISSIKHTLFVSGGTTYPTSLKSFSLTRKYNGSNINMYNLTSSFDSTTGVSASFGTTAAENDYVFFNYTGDAIEDFATYDPTTGKLYSNGFLIADSRHDGGNLSEYQGQFISFYASTTTTKLNGGSLKYARPYVTISYERMEPPEGVYTLGNLSASMNSGMDRWFFDKVEDSKAEIDGYFGPYYIRSYATSYANLYVGHNSSGLTQVTMSGDNIATYPSSPTSYYWYLVPSSNNTFYIGCRGSDYTKVLAVNSNYSSVTVPNSTLSLALQTATTSNYQKWTLTLSSTSKTFVWPVEEEVADGYSTYQCTSYFGYRGVSPFFHKAIDIKTSHIYRETGEYPKVYAIADGVVKEVGTNPNVASGYYVTIEHKSMLDGCGGYYSSKYMHLSVQGVVEEGQFIKQGQLIGISGTTGNSTGPHLHLQIERKYTDSSGNTSTVAINPTNIYGYNDTRTSNPNPIYKFVNDLYSGYNSDFIFNYDEAWTWSNSTTYKKS